MSLTRRNKNTIHFHCVLIPLTSFSSQLTRVHLFLYHYFNHKRNWTEAQRYCRKFYNDLATFESMDDIDQLNRPSFIEEWAWIGLWDDPKSWKGAMSSDSNSWRWSATGSTSTTGYHNLVTDFWFGKETCVNIFGQWQDAYCSNIYYFICYTGKKTFDAQSYCRANHKDLAMIENEEENRNVTSARRGHEAWIGLYREPWMWSDGSNSSFRNWIMSVMLNNSKLQPLGKCKVEIRNPRNLSVCLIIALMATHVVYALVCCPFLKFILIQSLNNWTAARDYCRTHHTDLAMIETGEENAKVAALRKQQTWIGLYRIPWRWSDGSNSAFKNWMAGEPVNPNFLENCAAENPDHTWTKLRSSVQSPKTNRFIFDT
uniref:C-type lectin domain-containing protein n=1 Tax=Salarias fasciatus TaxID=181472 RepID=A0A672FAR5_SALFA